MQPHGCKPLRNWPTLRLLFASNKKANGWLCRAVRRSNPTEDKFLADIRSKHRPVPALKDDVLEANIDWPRLSNVPALVIVRLETSRPANQGRAKRHAPSH